MLKSNFFVNALCFIGMIGTCYLVLLIMFFLIVGIVNLVGSLM